MYMPLATQTGVVRSGRLQIGQKAGTSSATYLGTVLRFYCRALVKAGKSSSKRGRNVTGCVWRVSPVRWSLFMAIR